MTSRDQTNTRGRSWTLGLTALAVVAVIAAIGVFRADRLEGLFASTADEDEPTTELPTAMIVRRDLVDSISWEGTFGYEAVTTLTHRTESSTVGTLTWLSDPSTIVEPGGVLYRVDDEAVILIEGDAILWRTLDTASEGVDVEAVERALVDMGYDPDETVTIDADFTTATAEMVERFQEAVEHPVTGVLDLGSVVMADGPIRIGEHLAVVGSDVVDTTEIVSVSSTRREASIDIDPGSRGLIVIADEVDVRLPDRTLVVGVVESISPTVDIETGLYVGRISVADDGGFESDQLGVTVLMAVTLVSDALIVPPDALVALEGNRYVVRVVIDSQVTSVPVDVLGEAGQSVAIAAANVDDGAVVVVTP